MRIVKLLVVVLLTILFNPGIAQIIKFGNLNYSHVPIVNGDVMINWGAPTPMKINITFTRPSIEPWVSKPIKGELVLFYDTNGNRYDLLSTTFTTSDWDAGSFVSHVINRDVTFPANVLNGFNGYLNVYAKYRYYRDKYPDPENTDGWTDWIAIPGYQRFALAPYTIPVTSFEGPEMICNEGIYTITNPYAISLVDAAGVATLTDMGQNKWKVTNVSGGGSAKTVKLRSTSSTKTFDKDIIIGGGYVTAVQGPSSGHGGETFEFTMEYIGQGTIKWKCNSPLVDMSFGTTGPNLFIQTAELLRNQKNQEVIIEGIFTSTCGVVTQINKRLILNP
ncbi:hypothetical protein [Sphingobacterium sp. BIGb0116]|uniref:hypothetical protein n=1 Tax=Sphingobacterium sp. BIGb0116 TaxID=2940619 RepID=UPI0021675009|nr:hypothetical protein [Sphingobacterium sp. BIGb0116]MCS4168528.1 hypothetical protein [Sphingobacterium sp. BIGb0116]